MSQPIKLEPMYEANQLLGDTTALRSRLQADGYLFFRSIIPEQRLQELREQVTGVLADIGWIKGGREQLQAKTLAFPAREGQPEYFEAHDRIVKLESLHGLAHEQPLMDVMRQALGDSAFPHPLSIMRFVFPDSPELSTPPHQDYPNNQGTENLTAAWIPLGDCSIEDGSLAVLEGSHKFGLLPLKFHLGPGNRGAVLSDEMADCRWVGADFKAGDILLFPALTVHRALDNRNPECMRLSVDFRYQLEGEALTPGCLKPHFERFSWEEIYRNWKSDKYQYYWRDKDYVEVPWDQSLQELPDHFEEAWRQEAWFEREVKRRRAARNAPAKGSGNTQQ